MSDQPYITCRQLIDFIADYLDGSLPAEQRAEFERHLRVCGPCVHYLASYQAAMKLGKAAFPDPDQPPPCGIPDDLVAAIVSARRKAEGKPERKD